jgi:hypothetical protein
MYQRSKQKHEKLHSRHGVLEDLPSVVLFFIIGTALARLPWRTLVFHLVDERAAAATPAGASFCGPKPLTVAVLGGLQEHPVQGVKEFCLSNTQFILVACMAQLHGQIKVSYVSSAMNINLWSG